MLEVGTIVRITSMARTDAIGEVIDVREGRYIVRLRNWQADGYHLDVACRAEELRRVR